jgi:hypothetical protein
MVLQSHALTAVVPSRTKALVGKTVAVVLTSSYTLSMLLRDIAAGFIADPRPAETRKAVEKRKKEERATQEITKVSGHMERVQQATANETTCAALRS